MKRFDLRALLSRYSVPAEAVLAIEEEFRELRIEIAALMASNHALHSRVVLSCRVCGLSLTPEFWCEGCQAMETP